MYRDKVTKKSNTRLRSNLLEFITPWDLATM